MESKVDPPPFTRPPPWPAFALGAGVRPRWHYLPHYLQKRPEMSFSHAPAHVSASHGHPSTAGKAAVPRAHSPSRAGAVTGGGGSPGGELAMAPFGGTMASLAGPGGMFSTLSKAMPFLQCVCWRANAHPQAQNAQETHPHFARALRTDIYENDAGLCFDLSVPGVNKDAIHLAVESNPTGNYLNVRLPRAKSSCKRHRTLTQPPPPPPSRST